MTREIKFVNDANQVRTTHKKYTFYDKAGNVLEKETMQGETYVDPPKDCLAYEVEINAISGENGKNRVEYHAAVYDGLVDPTSTKSSRNRMFKRVGEKCFTSYTKFLSTRIRAHYDQAVRWFSKSE